MAITLLVALVLAAQPNTTMPAGGKFGTRQEAEALVRKAVAHVRAVGAGQAYQDFTQPTADFTDRDLYVVVYDLDGRVLAHGQQPKLVGENLLNLRDPNGKQWVKERVELARKKDSFWHDYKFLDPVTKKALAKSTYCERVESTVVCSGVYRR